VVKNSEATLKKDRIDQLEMTICNLEKAEQAEEDAFIRENAPEFASLADIESEEDFDRLVAEFVALPKVIEIGAKLNVAKSEKKVLENEIIEMALSLTPTSIVADLRKGLHRVDFRKRIIDAYFL